MNNNICNICGANYEYRDGKWRCPACGAYKPEEISGEEETLLYNAAQKLRLCAFDDAEELYRDITVQYPKNSRGYWGLVLAKYGIKYEKDYDGKMVPSCYAASYESIFGDENYKKALQYADKNNRAYYEAQAKRIDVIRREWVEKAEREEPYDIFLSYKDSDKENGVERTDDSRDAYELYSKLKEKGYRVFYSRESLAGKEGEKFEPYIFNALNTAQVMIVYGTKPEYIESTWVKNEWMRYYKRIERGEKQKNSLILAYKGFNPSKLPKPLCDIQGIDLGRITVGFGDLETRVANILSAARMSQKIARVSVKGRERRAAEHIRRLNTVKVGKVVSEEPKTERARIATRTLGGKSVKLSVNAEKSLSVAESYLSRGQFAEAEERFDEILLSSPRNGRALTGKLLAQSNAQDLPDLEKNGFRVFPDLSLIENVLSNAEKTSAESVLRVLCAEASRSFDRGDIARAKLIVSVVKEYAGSAVDKLRGELYERGLNLVVTDEESAKYFLDIHLSFEENEEEYIEKLHSIVNSGIEHSAFTFAEYYADKLKEEDANSYKTQLSLLEIEYKTKDEKEVFRCIDREKAYRKIEDVLSELEPQSAAKWLQSCFTEIAELLQKGVYAGALRWIEICAKYQFAGRKELLESLLSICINSTSMRSAECFEAVLMYVADGDVSVYADQAKAFADTALKSREFDAAKLYYGKILSVKPDNIPAAQGKFFADIRCANEKDLPSALVNLTDWSCFEEVLIVQTDDADDLKWIEKLASACIEHIRKEGTAANTAIFGVFEKLLSYIPNSSDDVLLSLLRQAADLCLQEGLFAQAQKYYEMFISENAEDSSAYWGLLQAKLKCRNDDELVRQSQPISTFNEFENAQVCAADDKAVLNHYIDVRDKQIKNIKSAKKRRRIIKISAITLSAAVVIGGGLGGWFAYYNSQSGLIYAETNGGYAISAGRFYKADERLVIPDEYNGVPVVAIAGDGFAEHTEIEELVLPESVTRIEEGAFANCTSLAGVIISASEARTVQQFYAEGGTLEYIGDGALENCTALADFSFEYGLEYVGAKAFAGTVLSRVSLPSTVTYMGGEVFYDCAVLTEIIVGDREEIPSEWAENWNDGCNAAVDFRLRVVFDYNNATAGDTVNEEYVSFGGEFNFPVPERKGYAFDGWFREDSRLTDAQGRSVFEWQYEDGGIVAAHWAPNINEVIFNANGGEGQMAAQSIATDESAKLAANTFTRKGYTFAGWAENETGSVVYKDGAEYTMGAESSYELFAVWIANRNEIVFEGNGATGGSMDSQFIATDSSAALSSNAFEKAGYTFAGWATSTEGEAVYSDGAIFAMGAEQKYTLYAVWEATEYTIEYNLNNGSAEGNPSAYTVESADIVLNSPARAGYRFIGWTGTGLSEPALSVTIQMGSTGNREYTAVWEANTNTIVFNANGGRGEMPAQGIKTDETAPLAANAFTREGYTFVGWSEEPDGEVVYSDGANYAMGAESEYTLYAVWRAVEYTISYTLNGGSVSGNAAGYTIESDTFRLENPVRAGYTFIGWTGTDLAEPTLAVTVVRGSTGNREYTANWQANVNSVIFHANGGEGDMPAQEIQTDQSAPLNTNTFARAGYTFVGWSTSENGEVDYKDGETYIMGTQTEYNLYAAWELIEYSISYTLNGGAVSENPEIYTVTTAEFTLVNPVREGYTFTGWSGTGIDGLSVTVTVPAGSTGEREYVANWQANENKIIFHANGGTGDMSEQLIRTDETIALNDNEFVRAGYTFVGWAEEAEGEVAFANGADYLMGTSAEYNLYAVWTPNLNEVRFDGNGADGGEMTVQTGYTDSELVLSSNTFKRKGYQFVGWSVEKDGEVVYGDGAQILVGAEPSVTLYAKWQALSYNITLMSENSDFANVSVMFDSEYAFGVPERRGYTFGGWYSVPGGGGTKFTDGKGNGIDVWSYDGDITLYAYWLGTDGLAYTLNDGDTYTLTGLTDTDLTEVYIPEYYDGKPVTAIDENAFANGGNITEIIVPDSITTIGKGAFAGCTALQTLTLPFVGNSRTAEGEAALLGWLFSETQAAGCTLVYQYYSEYGMSAAYIPDSLAEIIVTDAENIGYGAFSSVTSLQSVSITANALGERAFYDCASLAEVELCDGITAIGQSAFARCVALQEIAIPASVQTVGRYAFDECAALTSLTLPFIGANASASGAEGALGYLFGAVSSADMVLVNQSSVTAYFPARLANLTITNATQIAANALRGLSMLKNISWNDGIISIGDYAMYGCTGVTALTLPASLQTVGNYALYNVKISVLELPQSVVSLGTYALYGSGLRTLLVPSSAVVSIGDRALDNTHSALKIYVTDSLLSSYKSAWSDYSSRIYSFNCIRENGMAIDGSTFLQYFGDETEIALPANVTSIGAYAFAGTNVRTVLVPGNIRTIGANAFSGCDTLESVRLLSGVRTISANAFYGAAGLMEVEIPNTVTSIGASAFYGCSSLQEVVVPNSVTSIGAGAFQGCNSLVKMTLPFVGKSRTATAYDAVFGYIFGFTTSLSDNAVSSGNSPTSFQNKIYGDIEEAIWQYTCCNYLHASPYYKYQSYWYYIPGSLREVVITDADVISDAAFNGCTMLTSITLNEGITAINGYAFQNCDGLTEIVIPESVTNIGSYAFIENDKLTEVTLPSGLTAISDYTFQNCTALVSVNGNGEVIIGTNVTSIGSYAFSGCASITKVTLPNGLAEIGGSAFSGATSLTQINIPASVAEIGASAFADCANLVRINSDTDGKVILQEGLAEIGGSAFRNLGKITEVVVPNSVTSIGQGAFQGCNSLVKMTLPFVGKSRTATAYDAVFGYIFGFTTSLSDNAVSSGNSPTSFQNKIYGDIEEAIWQYTCCNYLHASPYYKYQSYWYYIPGSLREVVITDADVISDAAFNGCTMLTSITLNEGITAINGYAFQNCDGLTEIVIPESVTSIGMYAFAESGNLAEVTLPSSLTEISDYIFSNCSSLTSVNGDSEVIIGANVTSIGIQAFANCSSITSVTMQGIVTSIGAQAFDGCVNLVRVNSGIDGKVILQEGLTSIGNFAFRNLGKITEVVVPNSVTSIGQGAFQGCNSLVKMTLPFVGGSRSTTSSTPTTSSGTWSGGSRYLFGYIFGGERSYISSAPTSGNGLIYQGEGAYSSHYYNRYYIPSSLREIVITDATGISANAFYNCTMLTSITLNEGITAIHTYAFYNCANIAEIVIPSSVESIGNYAFQKCSLLQTVQVLRGDVLSLTSLGSNVFDSTPATLLILVPDDAYSAYITAANWSTYADKIRPASASEDGFIIENGVLLHYIGTAETVTIPAGVTSIGDYAFAHNYTLKQLIIGNDVVTIGDYAFYQCLSLQSVVIGDSVQTIESFAFDQCISLQSVVIGEGIQTIARYAFYGCASLQGVAYGSNLQSIGEYAFADCPALSMINSENPNTFCIGDSVTSIGVAAFMGCNSLHSIVLPFVGADGTATAGYTQVFGYIFGYTTSNTAGTVEQVSGYYYYIPASLTNVVITQETSLAENAFTGCMNITSIELNAVQSISDYAFYGCDGLVSLTIRAQTVPALSANAFNGGKVVTVYVPAESVEAYKADSGWNKFSIQAIA